VNPREKENVDIGPPCVLFRVYMRSSAPNLILWAPLILVRDPPQFQVVFACFV
jgi:hypothetical protein